MTSAARRTLIGGLIGLLIVTGLIACQNPSAPRPAEQAGATQDLVTQARAAIDRRDWAAAAPLLRQALARSPDDLALRYALAITLTHLDHRNEAAEEFRWVLANAPAGSPEHRIARSWLAEAGLLDAPAAPAESRGTPAGERLANASLQGRVVWGSEPGGPSSTRRLQIHLSGLPGSPTEDQRQTVRTDGEGRYEFTQLVAGPYKISDRVAGTPTWRLRVLVEAGRGTMLDLHPGNSVRVRDDFPDGR